MVRSWRPLWPARLTAKSGVPTGSSLMFVFKSFRHVDVLSAGDDEVQRCEVGVRSRRQGFRRRLAYSYSRVGYRMSVCSSGAASVFWSGVDFKSATKLPRGFPTGALSPTSYIEQMMFVLVCSFFSGLMMTRSDLRGRSDLLPDRPQECGHLARDRGDCHSLAFSGHDELAIARA